MIWCFALAIDHAHVRITCHLGLPRNDLVCVEFCSCRVQVLRTVSILDLIIFFKFLI